MTAVRVYWGPGAFGVFNIVGSSLALNDADNSVMMTFYVPKSGTITDVAFRCLSIAGNPPAYNVGIVTVTASSGLPTTTPYGGSANGSKDYAGAGMEWVTLATPATATLGDLVAARIWPTGTAPDAGNCATIDFTGLNVSGHSPSIRRFTSAWTSQASMGDVAIRYNDGAVYGLPVTAFNAEELERDTSPDESGGVFTVPADMVCVGARIGISATDGDAPFTVKLYSAADAVLATVVVTDRDLLLPGSAASYEVYWTPVTLTAGATYRLTISSDSDTLGVTPGMLVFESAASLANNIMLPEAARWQKTSRANAGAWTDTPEQCPYMAVIVSDITFSTTPAPTTTTIFGTPAIPVTGLK